MTPMVANYWWLFIALLALVVAGWFVFMWMADRKRNESVENDVERLHQDPGHHDRPGPG